MEEITIKEMISRMIKMRDVHKVEVKDVLPLKIGNAAVNIFVDNFNKQGFDTGVSIEPWKEVQRRQQGLSMSIKSHRYKNPSGHSISSQLSGILIRSGRGRRDVQNSLRTPRTSRGMIIIPFEVADNYMGYHNEGTEKLPQRKFIGDSVKLHNKVDTLIAESFNKIFNTR